MGWRIRKKVREVFKKAKQTAPCIIFFDEIDALTSERAFDEADFGVGKRVISQLLTELDGIEELKGVVVLAATNRIDLVDSALLWPGRLIRFLKSWNQMSRKEKKYFKFI
jgi:transitional endoplasmic reticulum ATPase